MNKSIIEIIQIYWIIQAILIFNMNFFGKIAPIISICIAINYILKFIVFNNKYMILYSFFMIIYSIVYVVFNGFVLLFFKQSLIILSSMIMVIVLNFVISIITFLKYRKWYNS